MTIRPNIKHTKKPPRISTIVYLFYIKHTLIYMSLYTKYILLILHIMIYQEDLLFIRSYGKIWPFNFLFIRPFGDIFSHPVFYFFRCLDIRPTGPVWPAMPKIKDCHNCPKPLKYNIYADNSEYKP